MKQSLQHAQQHVQAGLNYTQATNGRKWYVAACWRGQTTRTKLTIDSNTWKVPQGVMSHGVVKLHALALVLGSLDPVWKCRRYVKGIEPSKGQVGLIERPRVIRGDFINRAGHSNGWCLSIHVVNRGRWHGCYRA